MNLFALLIEGGQTWAHRMRMLRQVVKLSLFLSVLLSLCVFLFLMYKVPSNYYLATWYHLKAATVGYFTPKMEVEARYWESLSREHHANPYAVTSAKKVAHLTEPHFSAFLDLVEENLKEAAETSSIALGIIVLFFLVRGAASKGKHHISGRRFAASWRLRWLLVLSRRASQIHIGNVPLVKGTETQHLMITGGTGSGKTNCLHHLLPQIRNQGQRAIIVDTTGAFVERYFREGKDILLSPSDKRSAPWHPWAE